MNIKPIRTEQDYEGALRAVEPMFDNEPEMNTSENAENVPTLRINEVNVTELPVQTNVES
ncbi:hypothetical protein [Escherichia albertii]|uniref:hypothetical protein n=1 Tax=Escherichia albertii TaxID=208962 RepID=UPI0010F7F7E2|nr:hypothetical protein [Escherichia albertii]